MNVAWRIESGREGLVQVGEGEVVLTNMEFKGKCQTGGKYGHKQKNLLIRVNQRKKKETINFLANAIIAVRWGIRLQTAWSTRLIKTRGPRTGRRTKTRK